MSFNFPLDNGGEDILLFGIPFDSTSSFLPGSRFAPQAIRQAAWTCEPYDVFQRRSIAPQLKDVGDLDVSHGNAKRTLDNAEAFLKDYKEKKLIALGGEHTISLAPIKVLEPHAVLSLDAHLDLRDEYLGEKLSHATVMRRVSEFCDVEIYGFREACREEMEYIQEKEIKCFHAREPFLPPTGERVYVSIDMDVFDGLNVGNPIPGGLHYWHVYDFLKTVFENNDVCGVDVVEVCSPKPDLTAITAAKLIFSAIGWWV